jgi:hypothetical protein
MARPAHKERSAPDARSGRGVAAMLKAMSPKLHRATELLAIPLRAPLMISIREWRRAEASSGSNLNHSRQTKRFCGRSHFRDDSFRCSRPRRLR